MSRCIVPVASGLVLVMLCATAGVRPENMSVVHVFYGLLLALIGAAVALWPKADRAQQAELELERPNWADHVAVPQHHQSPLRRVQRSPAASDSSAAA
jgi:hypothetical protein